MCKHHKEHARVEYYSYIILNPKKVCVGELVRYLGELINGFGPGLTNKILEMLGELTEYG